MHDIVITGGTILDGTGAPRFTGDVAKDGERIVAVGGKAGPARRVTEADGLLVTVDQLRLHQPEIVHDLPAGGRRLVQRADGNRAMLVAGTPAFEQGRETGARPGRLVRSGG
jgi:N-acyl-D-aspartate/D-glutamate deacylase